MNKKKCNNPKDATIEDALSINLSLQSIWQHVVDLFQICEKNSILV